MTDFISKFALEDIEDIERLTLRWVFQAVIDFGFDAYDIFKASTDDVQDIGEDITRELLDRLSGYNIQQRVLGNVDYRKARYIILPDQIVRQALFADSKAEKNRSVARMQLSQISMRVRHVRAGAPTDVPGLLPQVITLGGHDYLTTVVLLHYEYSDTPTRNLVEVTLCAVPNGLLQDYYNPTPLDTIWRAGPNSPARGEEFRTRLNFRALEHKKAWRVQRIQYNAEKRTLSGKWKDEL